MLAEDGAKVEHQSGHRGLELPIPGVGNNISPQSVKQSSLGSCLLPSHITPRQDLVARDKLRLAHLPGSLLTSLRLTDAPLGFCLGL